MPELIGGLEAFHEQGNGLSKKDYVIVQQLKAFVNDAQREMRQPKLTPASIPPSNDSTFLA
ncbi:hypothetical protein CSB09_04885 [Candidatus Gracilibacteria bacterium]|nr:MAG: hypothetical protein CSB09_04885 [Candidatus Gracilibacteria bacterium]